MNLEKAWHEVSLGIIPDSFKTAGICKGEGVPEDWEDHDYILLPDLE
jgi:hypothetical protein